MIMRDGNISIMMQHKEEDKVQKSTEKKYQTMTSTLTGEALIIVQSVI